MDEEKKEEKKIEIINGDGTNLNISPVYDHISTENPVNEDEPKGPVIIPSGIKQLDDDETESIEEETENTESNEENQ